MHPMNEPERVQRWGPSVKRIIIVIILVLLALILYRFRVVIPPLVIAFLIAFILDPIVDFLTARPRMARGLATAIVFLVPILLGITVMVVGPVTAVPAIQRAVHTVQFDFTGIISAIGDFFSRPLVIAGYSIDLSSAYQDLISMLRGFVTSVAKGTLNVVLTIASGAFWLIFILMAAFYMVKDADRITEQFDNLAPPGYRDDVRRLRQQITKVWNAFLRGELLLGLSVAVMTTVICFAIGIPYAWALGLLAGAMELLPSIGPVIAAIPAILLALFQGSNFLPLGNVWFAVLVAGLYIVIQQIENNLLVPRIMGRSLKLHPLAVLIAIIIGGNLGGILGILLAAPVLATLRVLGRYVFNRLYDRDPFAEPEKKVASSMPGLIKRAYKAAHGRLQEKVTPHVESLDSTGTGDG
jgi:predicted PurR-regulated permease PerM